MDREIYQNLHKKVQQFQPKDSVDTNMEEDDHNIGSDEKESSDPTIAPKPKQSSVDSQIDLVKLYVSSCPSSSPLDSNMSNSKTTIQTHKEPEKG